MLSVGCLEIFLGPVRVMSSFVLGIGEREGGGETPPHTHTHTPRRERERERERELDLCIGRLVVL